MGPPPDPPKHTHQQPKPASAPYLTLPGDHPTYDLSITWSCSLQQLQVVCNIAQKRMQ